jgi:uroporphyrinogen-III synthase
MIAGGPITGFNVGSAPQRTERLRSLGAVVSSRPSYRVPRPVCPNCRFGSYLFCCRRRGASPAQTVTPATSIDRRRAAHQPVRDEDDAAATMKGPLHGRRIALLETREADRLAAMLRDAGAEIVACPAVAIVLPADPAATLAWLGRFIAAPFDDLILLTGEGLSRLCELARPAGIEPAFLAALGRTRTICRGPKPVRVLRMLGQQPQLRAEEPTTEGVVALLSGLDLRGRTVGLQLYPGAGDRLVAFLEGAGAVPDPVTPYEYASRAADETILALIDQLATGAIDIIALTSAPQVRRLFDVAHRHGVTDRLITGLGRTTIAAIGPLVAAAVRRHGVAPAIMPSGTYFIKPLVSAITAAISAKGN